MLRPVVALLVVSTTCCTVDVPTSADGRPCPCPQVGYDCIEGTCVSTGLDQDCTPLVTAEDFRPTWSTPESIRWDWTPMGNESDFTAYELVVAKSEKDAVGASGSARVFDATVNPELGFYIVPQEMGAFEVSFTISDDLEPFRPSDDNRYYAQLRTHDVAGCVHVTSVAQATTKLAPFNWIPIFDEVLDYELFGSPLTLEPGCGIDGSKCLRCRALSCLDVPDPWDNMKLTGSIDLSTVSDNAITSGQAYLELSVAVVSDTPVFYSEVALTRGPTDSQASWKVERVHIRAAGTPNYQTMQFPLNSMLHQNQGFTHADLATPLTQFRLGAEFINATDVYLDHIGVGW